LKKSCQPNKYYGSIEGPVAVRNSFKQNEADLPENIAVQQRDFAFLRDLMVVKLGAVMIIALTLVLYMSGARSLEGNPLSLVNVIGLAAFVIGIIAAGFILRRTAPQT